MYKKLKRYDKREGLVYGKNDKGYLWNLIDSFSISIISHTYNNTNLKLAKVNDLVNIEFDALARYFFKNGSK